MHNKRLLILLVLMMICCRTGYSQAWSGVINSTRAVDWSAAGTVIPARTIRCATLNPGTTAANINSAIAACAPGQTVYLNAGTYNLTSGIDFGQKSNVTLRGAGADQTFLIFAGDTSCNGLGADICIAGSNSYSDGPNHLANWTAGYSKGSTSITLANSLGIVAGSTMLNLDQLDETTDTGSIWNCLTTSVCSNGGSGGGARGGNRSQEQQVLVTACSPSCNSSSSTTITISPGLYMPNWKSSQSPAAWWASTTIMGSGVESISMNHNAASTNGVLFVNCYQCFVRGVRSLYAQRAHVGFYGSLHSTVRDSYFYENKSHGSTSYGIELFGASDSLIENNIFDRVTDSTPNNNAGGAGNVAAYNYSIETNYTNSNGWFQASDYEHASGASFWLREGNQGTGFTSDNVHGTHHFTTLFRNNFTGWQSACPPGTSNTCTAQTIPIHLYASSRYFNVVGNVLGRSGYHTRYESLAPSGTSGNSAIFTVGWTGNGGSTDSSIQGFCLDFACSSRGSYDPLTAATLMRWGNYDTVSATTRFQSSEVPSGINLYPNAIPASQNLPASFYLSGRPGWWAPTIPFPANGPDVAGGNIAGLSGHANNIPAAVCFLNTSSTSGILNFSADTCYMTGTTDTTPPSVSITLQ